MKDQPSPARARWAAGLKLAIAVAAVTGVAIDLAVWDDARGKLNLFSYYTEQSNLLVAFVFAWVALKTLVGGEPGRSARGAERAARVWILLTGLAFHFLLSGTYHPQGAQSVSNVLLHYVVPVAVLLEWLLLEPKGAYRLTQVGLWVAFPLAYCVFSLARGQVDGFYPYWFVNPNPAPAGVGSLAAVGLWVAALATGLVLIGLLLTGLDALLARRRGAAA